MYKKCFKRVFDFILSLFALTVLSPVLLVLTVLGAVKMKGNPFFVQERPGLTGLAQVNGRNAISWEDKFRLDVEYHRQHGNLEVYVAEGVWLRRWLSEQTARMNERPTGRNKAVKNLTEEQTLKLQSVGIQPDIT